MGTDSKLTPRTATPRISTPRTKPSDTDGGGVKKENGATSSKDATVKQPAEHPVSSLSILTVVTINLVCILTLCFMYSFSAFKLDLKQQMGWDENQLSTVFMLATAGQNFVVHIGLFCDKYGAPWGFVLPVVLKAVGLGGMWWCSSTHITSPWIFGAFFFLDTQGMSGGLIMAMKEVQRASPPRFGGLMASLSKASFGMGAVYMTSLFDYMFRPDVPTHFLAAGVQGVVTLTCCAVFVPLLLPQKAPKPQTASPSKKDLAEASEEPVMPIIFSEGFFGCFMGMLVCWGGGMVWNANMASFSIASGFSLSDQKAIRSYFYSAKTGFSLCVGPLTDIGGHELWYALTTILMFSSSAVMYVSDGKLIFIAATMAGGAFGAVATLIPIMSKRLSFKHMGTLYALAKGAGMISGLGWNYHAGSVAQSLTAKGESNCIGDMCYRQSWQVILSTQAPLVAYVTFWALKSLFKGKPKKKVD
eukprot:TRINITY_DN7760_c0_g1_i1.p1 TRINITY_DN7760_c0_g1~~TRINITY_DN7760_c0_g1_i1.p1  ORF type:complete len:473 (-),score=59.01 TRINITY_DN7760_c0_g1_i1:185-1603(-)